MKLKQRIKNWLEIKDPPTLNFDEYVNEFITHHNLKEEVRKAIKEAFDPGSQYWTKGDDLSGTFDGCVKRLIGDEVRKLAKHEIVDRINGEEFIDDIIIRINKKQLK